MVKREHCPITNRHSEVVFARPYSSPALRRMVDRGNFQTILSDKLYEVRYCAESDLHFQTWVMEQQELGDWYSAPPDDARFMAEIGKQKIHWFAHQTEEILVLRQMCPANMPVALDFGCKWGKWASMALAHGCDVYGVDVNPAAAAFCAQRGIKMVDGEQLEDLRFDVINCDQVMEHVSDPLGLVNLFSGCLKPGGFLKLSTPDNPRLPHLLSGAQRRGDESVLDPVILDSLYPLEHVNLFSRAALDCLAERAGLVPCRLPLFKWLGAGQLWNLPRQFNRNLLTPFKRWLGRGTYGWYRKSPA